jgi:hypothetical protein
MHNEMLIKSQKTTIENETPMKVLKETLEYDKKNPKSKKPTTTEKVN